jgi:hypothetical protein
VAKCRLSLQLFLTSSVSNWCPKFFWAWFLSIASLHLPYQPPDSRPAAPPWLSQDAPSHWLHPPTLCLAICPSILGPFLPKADRFRLNTTHRRVGGGRGVWPAKGMHTLGLWMRVEGDLGRSVVSRTARISPACNRSRSQCFPTTSLTQMDHRRTFYNPPRPRLLSLTPRLNPACEKTARFEIHAYISEAANFSWQSTRLNGLRVSPGGLAYQMWLIGVGWSRHRRLAALGVLCGSLVTQPVRLWCSYFPMKGYMWMGTDGPAKGRALLNESIQRTQLKANSPAARIDSFSTIGSATLASPMAPGSLACLFSLPVLFWYALRMWSQALGPKVSHLSIKQTGSLSRGELATLSFFKDTEGHWMR